MPKMTPLKKAIFLSERTGYEIARAIGQPDTQLSHWANDSRVCPPDVQVKLAAELNTTVEALFPPKPEQSQVAA